MININIFYIFITSLSIPETKYITFFSGGSNYISNKIYSDFFDKFDKYNIVIYEIPFKKNNYYENLITEITDNHDDVTIMGHSSGCTTAINNCNDKIKNLILLDPVKTPNFNENKNLSYLENFIIINAGKSYEWSFFPPFLPFIPLFKLEKNDIYNLLKSDKSDKIDKIRTKIKFFTFKKFGHSDIINNPYRNLMHYSRISRGYNKRQDLYINKYHENIAKIINYILIYK